MATDWVARGLGIAGAVSGFGALFWNVFSWSREGPVVKAYAHVLGGGPKLEIVGRVINRGRQPATIRDIEVLYAMPGGYTSATDRLLLTSRSERDGRPLTEIRGLKLDEPMLPQTGQDFVIPGLAAHATDLADTLRAGEWVCLRFWTATDDTILAKVKYPRHYPKIMLWPDGRTSRSLPPGWDRE